MIQIKAVLKKVYLFFRVIVLGILFGIPFLLRKKTLNDKEVKRIFIFSLKRVGDVVVSLPTLKGIREKWPQAKITVFATSYTKDIFESIDSVDTFISYPMKSSIFEKIPVLKKALKEKCDLGIDLTCDSSLGGALLTFISQSKFRVGYGTAGRGFLFNVSMKHPQIIIPVIDEILFIVKDIGVKPARKDLVLNPCERVQKELETILEQTGISANDKLIGIHAGGQFPTQQWPVDKIAQIGREIIEKFQAKVILISGPGEEERNKMINSNMNDQGVLFCNQPLSIFLALIQRCDLLICSNSGPLHVASAVKTPTVSAMGPTVAERWWPNGEGHIVLKKDLPCMPCNKGICPLKTHACINMITVDEVLESVNKQLS